MALLRTVDLFSGESDRTPRTAMGRNLVIMDRGTPRGNLSSIGVPGFFAQEIPQVWIGRTGVVNNAGARRALSRSDARLCGVAAQSVVRARRQRRTE